MKLLHQYIYKSLLITFAFTLLVMIGILCLGNLLKIADLIVKGMDPTLILKFFVFLIVSLLQYAIPMGILTATILVFGRLSADNEITAMRASGVGLSTITAPVFALAVILTLICLYLHNTAIPNYNFAIRRLKTEVGLQDPEVLLTPGELVRLPGYDIQIQGKEDGILKKVLINQYRGEKRTSTIFAEEASISHTPDQEGFTLKLTEGTLEEFDVNNPQVSTHTTFGRFDYPIDLEVIYEEQENISKRTKDMTRTELIETRRDLLRTDGADRSTISAITTELHKRLSLSLACVSFVLLGIPLAIRAHRGEKSIGMALSLGVIFVFYLFVAYAQTMDESPQKFPHLIIWVPNLLYAGFGWFRMVKYTRI